MAEPVTDTKYIFVTGGVVSSIGKGTSAAALGMLLKSRGYRVVLQKFDPYINVDPGTMNPYQHGEVFVTEDGAETDLDLGHYERFLDENLGKLSNVTTGSVYWEVIQRERRGDYLGATVQVIPHITNEIKNRTGRLGRDKDIVITEIGGTVGDIESLPFLEAIRQFRNDVGRKNVLYVHVSYVPYIEAAGAGGVGKLDSVHQSSVSRSNAFLTEIGVLQGESKKLITRRGRSLALALAHKDGAGIKDNWRAIVAASEFLQNVVSAVKLREGMLYPTVQAYIAHAAGQPRNKPVMNGAGAIIEILKASGMLREEAGELVATFDERPEVLIPEEDPPAQTFETRESVVTVGEVNGTPAGTSPTVSIHVQIRCTAEEIDDLAPRLKSLLRELSTEP